MIFPTRNELQRIIDSGKKCDLCRKKSAEIVSVNSILSIGYCQDCQDKQSYSDNSIGSNRVHSVWTDEKGHNIPVNEKGNIINSSPKYTKRKGDKPLW